MLITPNTPTVLKSKLADSSTLKTNEKINALPGNVYYPLRLQHAPNNHWRMTLSDGRIWFLFKPHWKMGDVFIPTETQLFKSLSGHNSREKDLRIKTHYPFLMEAFQRFSITTFNRVAIALAQFDHESGGFMYLEELASGHAYEGRKDLGNIQKGDGVRYKGRGIIQLTGRVNYRNAGKALGVDLENNPTLAAKPEYASLIAGWYWNSRNLNLWADKEDFRKVTALINGGYNGLSDRLAKYEHIKGVLASA